MPDHPKPAAPREITPDEHQDRAEEAFALDQGIKSDLRTGRASLWRVAEKLYLFDEVAGWSALGYDRLADWLADPEVSMRSSTYYAAVARWRKLTVLRSVDSSRLENLDPSKIDVVLPSIERSTVKLEDALADVEELGQRDLREKYLRHREKAEPDPPEDLPEDVEPDEPEPEEVSGVVVEDDPDGGFDGSDGETSYQFENEPAEPAHNPEHDAPSGQLPPVPHPNIGGLRVVVHAAEDALRRPDRQAVDRRNIRAALRDLIAVVKTIDGWDRT